MANVKIDKVVVRGGASGNGATAGVGSFVRDLAGVSPPVMEAMRDIAEVQLSENVAGFVEEDGAASARTVVETAEPADDLVPAH